MYSFDIQGIFYFILFYFLVCIFIFPVFILYVCALLYLGTLFLCWEIYLTLDMLLYCIKQNLKQWDLLKADKILFYICYFHFYSFVYKISSHAHFFDQHQFYINIQLYIIRNVEGKCSTSESHKHQTFGIKIYIFSLWQNEEKTIGEQRLIIFKSNLCAVNSISIIYVICSIIKVVRCLFLGYRYYIVTVNIPKTLQNISAVFFKEHNMCWAYINLCFF